MPWLVCGGIEKCVRGYRRSCSSVLRRMLSDALADGCT